jgi:hypothetical protein
MYVFKFNPPLVGKGLNELNLNFNLNVINIEIKTGFPSIFIAHTMIWFPADCPL